MKKDPPFDRQLHLTIGAGIIVFGFAEPNIGLTLLALAVWAGAWFIAVGPKGEPLPRVAIGLLVFGATAYTVLSIISIGASELVSGVARYILFLQLIKLFDRIAPRDRGQLLAMSVALVIGACLMSNRLLLGVGLIFYVPLVLWSAASLQLHVGRARTQSDRQPLPVSADSHADVRKVVRRTVFVSGAMVLVVTVLGFIFLPRGIDPDVYSQLLSSRGATVGFEDEVRLGAGGLLSASEEPVLELRLTNLEGQNEPIRVGGMYLRGAVLDHYENGSWIHRERSNENQPSVLSSSDWWRFNQAQDTEETIIQRIELKDKTRPQLFSVYRPIAISSNQFTQIRHNRRTQTLSTESMGRFSYSILATPPSPSEQRQSDSRLPRLFASGAIFDETVRLLESAGLSRDPSRQHAPDDMLIARHIENHLQGRCSYTTEMVVPDAGEEPIEMFLFRTRRGHCEYFASAMAAMLRSIGMDARVVTGFVVTEARVTGDSYVVRQSDAHAWVEAQVLPGVWTRFDPSPPAEIEAIHASKAGIGRLVRELREGLQDVWARAVVGYSRDRQVSLFGDWAAPLEGRLRRFLQSDAGTGVRSAPMKALVSAATIAVVVFSLATAAGFIGRWVARRGFQAIAVWYCHKRMSSGDDELRERLRSASFYFEAMRRLRRAGIAPPEWSPPLLHAQQLQETDSTLADALHRIVLLYYSARYGGRALTDGDRAIVQAAMATVDERLRAIKADRRRGKTR